MDWTDILYFIDEAVRPEKTPTRRAREALDNLKHQLELRIVARREEMGGKETRERGM
jgi:hypothetical protein